LLTCYLKHFNTAWATELFVDAGPHGLGAILTQKDEFGNIWLIAFSEIEHRFSQIEKEAMGLPWALLHFKYYLLANNNFI